MGHSQPLFLYYHLFNTVDSKRSSMQIWTGFKLSTSGVTRDRFTNLAKLRLNEYTLEVSLSKHWRSHCPYIGGLIVHTLEVSLSIHRRSHCPYIGLPTFIQMCPKRLAARWPPIYGPNQNFQINPT